MTRKKKERPAPPRLDDFPPTQRAILVALLAAQADAEAARKKAERATSLDT